MVVTEERTVAWEQYRSRVAYWRDVAVLLDDFCSEGPWVVGELDAENGLPPSAIWLDSTSGFRVRLIASGQTKDYVKIGLQPFLADYAVSYDEARKQWRLSRRGKQRLVAQRIARQVLPTMMVALREARLTQRAVIAGCERLVAIRNQLERRHWHVIGDSRDRHLPFGVLRESRRAYTLTMDKTGRVALMPDEPPPVVTVKFTAIGDVMQVELEASGMTVNEAVKMTEIIAP